MLALIARGGLALLLGAAIAAPSLLPLAELSRRSSFYRMTDGGELIWTLFLDQSRRTVPLALFAPAPLVLMRDKLPIVFPWAIGPTLGVLGLVAAVTGVLCGGLDAALAAVGLLGIGLTTMPPGLTWLHDLPGIHLVLPRYGWVLIALPLTQAAGRGMAALGIPAGRRRAVVALGLVLAGFASLALVRDSWPVNYGSELHRVLGTSEGFACSSLRRWRSPSWHASCARRAGVRGPSCYSRPSRRSSRSGPPAATALRSSCSIRHLRPCNSSQGSLAAGQ